MAKDKPKSKQESGGARLKAAGKVAVLIGLDPESAETIRAAAKIDNRPVTQFLTHHGLTAARKILAKNP